jgi:hypothetical protein
MAAAAAAAAAAASRHHPVAAIAAPGLKPSAKCCLHHGYCDQQPFLDTITIVGGCWNKSFLFL